MTRSTISSIDPGAASGVAGGAAGGWAVSGAAADLAFAAASHARASGEALAAVDVAGWVSGPDEGAAVVAVEAGGGRMNSQ